MTARSSALPLRHAKLSPPQLIPDHVPRRRLLSRLATAGHRSLTLLQAPAGAGKSTLLSEWLTTVAGPSAWVALDERDNEVDVFLAYVLAAVQAAVPDATLGTSALLRALIPPPPEALAITLSNDLQQIATEFVLILDDYHVIRDPQIHALVESLLRHPPANLRLVVATRADPPWPLATLRARGQLMELQFADLQFSATESATFLRRRLGDDLTDEQVQALHDACEGWPAGLQLANVALDSPRSWNVLLARLPDITSDIAAELLGDAFARLPPALHDNLLRLSILDWITPPLSAAVCGRAWSVGPAAAREPAVLDALRQAGLFIVPRAGHPETYRFHHLVRHFLAERLHEQLSADEIAGLHQRASDWFAGEGQIEDALAHALAAADGDRAARLVAGQRHRLYDQGQFALLARWLRRLPADLIDRHAELLMASARIATFNWQFSEAAALLDRAEQMLAAWPAGDTATDAARGELTALRLMIALWSTDPERLRTGGADALRTLPPDATHLRAHAHTAIAASMYLNGHLNQAVAYLDEQLANLSPRTPAYAGLLHPQAILHWLNGDLTRLFVAATRLLHVSEELDLPELEATAHGLLGAAHYARNELAPAEQHLAKAVAARFTMRLLWWCDAAGVLVLTRHALGRPKQAREVLAEASAFVLEQHAMRVLPNIEAYQAELDRRQGRLLEASRWASQVEPAPLTLAVPMLEPGLVQARVFLAHETAIGREYAAARLAELRAFCARIPSRRLRMDVDLLEAMLLDRRGEEDQALRLVERVLAEALPDGWVRSFVDLGPRTARLLTRLAPRSETREPIARLLRAFPSHAARPTGEPTPGIEPLSAREQEILQGLAARDSNKEIAARLAIAPRTVQRHTINLYRKLGVNDRRQAVARARELGLLPQG